MWLAFLSALHSGCWYIFQCFDGYCKRLACSQPKFLRHQLRVDRQSDWQERTRWIILDYQNERDIQRDVVPTRNQVRSFSAVVQCLTTILCYRFFLQVIESQRRFRPIECFISKSHKVAKIGVLRFLYSCPGLFTISECGCAPILRRNHLTLCGTWTSCRKRCQWDIKSVRISTYIVHITVFILPA